MKQSEIKAAVKKASKQVSKMTKAEKQKLEEEARRIIWQKMKMKKTITLPIRAMEAGGTINNFN